MIALINVWDGWSEWRNQQPFEDTIYFKSAIQAWGIFATSITKTLVLDDAINNLSTENCKAV